LEILLSVFDQENRTDDRHILNVNEDDFPEKYRPLIRRLKMAASNPEVKQQMKAEDEVFRYMQDLERGGYYKGHKEGEAIGLEKGEAIGLEKGRVEGLEKGEAIGLEKGEAKWRAERENMVLISRRSGLSIETISAITGLVPEQITEILKRNEIG
jgi:predicted transposase YdaD